MRAVLVDDEGPARSRLRALLAELDDVTVVAEAADADAARTAVATHAPDVVFLDIEMPAERGTELAASLPEPRPLIVFATAYERFALDAFQYDAADYLLKPVTRQRLAATVSRLQTKVRAKHDAERELVAASRAQAHLLPRELPALAGWGSAARTLAARRVGGDFYDAVLVDDRLAFVLGDVAGKGMAAGLIASSVQARWHSAMQQRDVGLSEMMTALNRDVLASTEGSRYATLVHGLLDPLSGELRFVNAGHPSSLLVDVHGQWRPVLAATAPALGLVDAAAFAVGTQGVAAGETLIVVSDGVTEALDGAGNELDPASIAALVPGHATDTSSLAAAVVDLVTAHRGLAQDQDDVTVFVLRRFS